MINPTDYSEQNRLQLKVCGMGTPENIREVASLDPDYLGFIFYKGSLRNFQGEIPPLSENIKKTGVFVNATTQFIQEKIKQYELNVIQLHGEESPKFCQALKSGISEKNNVELIKVFSIGGSFNFKELRPYEDVVDLFLFDTKGKNKGGNGEVFNWEVLKDYPSSTPFLLSGGIGLEETEAIKMFYDYFKRIGKQHLLYGIDVNSKFEIAPAFKDKSMLEKLKKELLNF